MESWSLPPDAALRLHRLERDLGEARVAGPDGALIRGAHWRNFLVKYTESNRMHKKMVALSELARRAGDPPGVRRAIGRAQCNDAYWHGVFGGLYLPHLRDAIWRNLADAEGALRQGEGLAWDVLDFDGDGEDEVWVHSRAFAALVSPARGGAVEEYTVFANAVNYANALTRRREAYHDLALERGAEHANGGDGGTASIHDIEEGIRLDTRPPLDRDDRALFVDRLLPGGLALAEYARGDYPLIRSWARERCTFTVERRQAGVEIVCAAPEGRGGFRKRIRFEPEGGFTVSWTWDRDAGPPDSVFATELSLGGPLLLRCTPAIEPWRFDIETVAKSERGLDRTRQGESVTFRWPVELGSAAAEVRPPNPS
jgi:alpha-amylase